MVPFRYRIVVEWSDEDDRFLARVPALPGCMAHGKTEGTAAHEARKAAEAILAVMKEDGDEPPPFDTAADYSGQTRIRVPRGLHAHLAARASAEDVSLNTLLVSLLSAGIAASGGRESAEDVDAHSSASHERPVRAPRAKLKKAPQRRSA